MLAMKLRALFVATAMGLLTTAPAWAVNTIKQPGMHTDYVFEAEPHLAVGFDLPGKGNDKIDGAAFGPGFRGTIELVDNGFVKTINNTVGLGFGIDWLSPGDKGVFWVPVVMQWNFWLSDKWSVFGEPGGGLYFGKASGIRPAFYAGGRFHFSDRVALTLRAGYPNFTVGVSFLL
jgi:hypothetical protein